MNFKRPFSGSLSKGGKIHSLLFKPENQPYTASIAYSAQFPPSPTLIEQ